MCTHGVYLYVHIYKVIYHPSVAVQEEMDGQAAASDRGSSSFKSRMGPATDVQREKKEIGAGNRTGDQEQT